MHRGREGHMKTQLEGSPLQACQWPGEKHPGTCERLISDVQPSPPGERRLCR